jgi:phage gp46-like protein
MSDIGLFWSAEFGAADFEVENNDLATDAGLETAVLLSLFLDRREGDERGWWGDAFATTPGDPVGSRLWTLARSKDTPAVLLAVPPIVKEALAWMVEDRVAASVEVTAESLPLAPGRTTLLLTITIERPVLGSATFRYDYNWAAQQARRA